MVSTNIKVPDNDLAVLRAQFPQCFDKEGGFEFDKFKALLSAKQVGFSAEGYGLDWLGKSYSRLLACDAATTLLREDALHNALPENVLSENVLLKGDNLEVLKHLSNAYFEKVKMIYIDPPYNTGGDGFVYQDDRKFNAPQLAQLAGITLEKAQRILAFTKSKSNSHSAWLTFMYPRLYIAHKLLRDDGVIFISIDDNEVAQLRLLMDEIFGEENFVANFLWKKKGTTSNVEGAEVSSLIDSTLCYRKTGMGKIAPRVKSVSSRNYPQSDDTGQYRTTVVEKKNDGSYARASMTFPIMGVFPREGKRWQIGQVTARELEANNRFIFDGEKILLKIYDFEDKDTTSAHTNLLDNHGSSDSAIKQIKDLFEGVALFDTPKPIDLVRYLTEISTNQDDLILDFFAGSGTTGDAVMRLNAQDGGRRRFILVQLPEKIDPQKSKAAHDFVTQQLGASEATIFEITKERLVRAAHKINAEDIAQKIQEKQTALQTLQNSLDLEDKEASANALQNEIDALQTQDLGFKVFETLPLWDDYEFEAEELNPNQTLFDSGKLNPEDIEALLTTWKTRDGIALTEELEKIPLQGKDASLTESRPSDLNPYLTPDLPPYLSHYHHASGKLYLMQPGFRTAHLKTLLERIDQDRAFNPVTIIAFAYQFESKSLRELAENIKAYRNKKNSDIAFIARY